MNDIEPKNIIASKYNTEILFLRRIKYNNRKKKFHTEKLVFSSVEGAKGYKGITPWIENLRAKIEQDKDWHKRIDAAGGYRFQFKKYCFGSVYGFDRGVSERILKGQQFVTVDDLQPFHLVTQSKVIGAINRFLKDYFKGREDEFFDSDQPFGIILKTYPQKVWGFYNGQQHERMVGKVEVQALEYPFSKPLPVQAESLNLNDRIKYLNKKQQDIVENHMRACVMAARVPLQI